MTGQGTDESLQYVASLAESDTPRLHLHNVLHGVYGGGHQQRRLASGEFWIMPNFLEFDRENSHYVPDEPMFTLQKRGLISMNQAAFKALGEPAAVALLYDPDEGIVAMRKVPRTYHNGYLLRKQNAARSYLLAATGFTSFHKINTDVSRRYVGQRFDDQVLGFVLADGKPIRSQRKPKASVHDIRETDYGSRRPANG